MQDSQNAQIQWEEYRKKISNVKNCEEGSIKTTIWISKIRGRTEIGSDDLVTAGH